MPNLLTLSIRSIKNRIKNNYLKLPDKVKSLIVSPGGCGTVTLKNFLENYVISNNYLEKTYGVHGSSHIFKPPKLFIKNRIKVIIIKRDINEIYQSLSERGFLRNSLIHYGDFFPFMYVNVLKDNDQFKKKFLKYIKLFYSNWEKYPSDLKKVLEYKKLYSDTNSKHIIKEFFNINDPSFISEYPSFKRYSYKVNNLKM